MSKDANPCGFVLTTKTGAVITTKPCGEPSMWMTDDGGDVHFYCGKHCVVVLRDGVAKLVEPDQASL